MRHNSHTPTTMAATMLSNRTVSYRVEPDIKPDMERQTISQLIIVQNIQHNRRKKLCDTKKWLC
jgi:hypothetical protein